jgi:hypothetical protein
MKSSFNPTSVRAITRDGMQTYDRQTIDSSGAFLIGELERLDQTINEPLRSIQWTRDIQLREDVGPEDEYSSFTNSTFAAAGGANSAGKSFIGKNSSAIAAMSLDIGKTTHPLLLWGMEVSYTLPELISSQKLGRPVDSQKVTGMNLKFQMDIDEMVATGDSSLGVTGLYNNANVSTANAPTGSWATATPAQMLADVNELLNRVYAASGWAFAPRDLRIDPTSFSILVSTIVSSAGNMSVLEYIKQNSLSNAVNGVPLNIQPAKFLVGAGASGKNRMVAYTNDKQFVRYPMCPLQRTPLEYKGLVQATTYWGRLGVVEFPYPTTVGYSDGL